MTKIIGHITKIIGHMTKDIGHKITGENLIVLEPLFTSRSKEQVLIFLLARGEGYAREIARFFETDLYGIQNQLDKLEAGGVIVSKRMGRTRVYSYNPRYALVDELRSFLEKALTFYSEEEREALLMNRRRPRIRGKSV